MSGVDNDTNPGLIRIKAGGYATKYRTITVFPLKISLEASFFSGADKKEIWDKVEYVGIKVGYFDIKVGYAGIKLGYGGIRVDMMGLSWDMATNHRAFQLLFCKNVLGTIYL